MRNHRGAFLWNADRSTTTILLTVVLWTCRTLRSSQITLRRIRKSEERFSRMPQVGIITAIGGRQERRHLIHDLVNNLLPHLARHCTPIYIQVKGVANHDAKIRAAQPPEIALENFISIACHRQHRRAAVQRECHHAGVSVL